MLEASNNRFSSRQRVSGKFQAASGSLINVRTSTVSSASLLGTTPTTNKPPPRPRFDDKLAALRAARRAKGLCMKCGEQYSPQHRCPKNIPLHVLEEVLELFQHDASSDHNSDSDSQGSDEDLLTLSYCAMAGIQGKRTLRLAALVNNQELLILVDSGSSETFISDKIVHQLNLSTVQAPTQHVSVADGTKLTTDKRVIQLPWWTQGHKFFSDAKVLSLGCYDIILGMDWLEQFSPMWVD